MTTSDSKLGQEKIMACGGSISQDDSAVIVQKIDAKMGKGWASKFANVIDSDMTLKAEVSFTFEKFDSLGNFKYSSSRKIKA